MTHEHEISGIDFLPRLGGARQILFRCVHWREARLPQCPDAPAGKFPVATGEKNVHLCTRSSRRHSRICARALARCATAASLCPSCIHPFCSRAHSAAPAVRGFLDAVGPKKCVSSKAFHDMTRFLRSCHHARRPGSMRSVEEVEEGEDVAGE
mmetsp:Transcript_26943/g.75659  ORF Transcript_26943/g.75659 Transcript_26943/m.75659 type:complete len:153 (-) Transcript_26943:441-899(-)|eukprot:scaffold48713_cov28-Tisochrysis_lutea.AAC.3